MAKFSVLHRDHPNDGGKAEYFISAKPAEFLNGLDQTELRKHVVAQLYVNSHLPAEQARIIADVMCDRLNEVNEVAALYLKNQFMQKRHP